MVSSHVDALAVLLPDHSSLSETLEADAGIALNVKEDKSMVKTNQRGEEELKRENMASTPLMSHIHIIPPSKVSVTGTSSAQSSIVSESSQTCEHLYVNSETVAFYPKSHVAADSVSQGEQRISMQEPTVTMDHQVNATTGGAVYCRKVSLDDVEGSYVCGGPILKKPRIEKTSNESPSTAKTEQPRQSFKGSKILLLARPTDAAVLSSLHVFVRQQVEVFSATEEDIALPAPGRKNRIQLNQVGLRCIHCRDLAPRDRVKRAVCYPSSVGRVYHSVSDMKFDHFSHCKGLPADIRANFQELKQESKQKRPRTMSKTPTHLSSSTAQCYHDSAREMGMVDAEGGLFMAKDLMRRREGSTYSNQTKQVMTKTCSARIPILPKYTSTAVTATDTSNTVAGFGLNASQLYAPHSAGDSNSGMMSSLASFLYSMNNNTPFTSTHPMKNDQIIPTTAVQLPRTVPASAIMTGKTSYLLTSQMDQHHLNPLHCFVRRHIELFIADKNDIAAPAPGRKTRVVLGQVGLRCIHCAALPLKDRVKRAVCYPAAVSGIYHSVSNMKFDHFDKCRGLPESERAIFSSLRTSCGRHGPRSVSGSDKTISVATNSNSTAQYYHDSAFRLGLIDSELGMRFQHSVLTCSANSTVTQPHKSSTTATDGISALMIAANVRAGVDPSKPSNSVV